MSCVNTYDVGFFSDSACRCVPSCSVDGRCRRSVYWTLGFRDFQWLVYHFRHSDFRCSPLPIGVIGGAFTYIACRSALLWRTSAACGGVCAVLCSAALLVEVPPRACGARFPACGVRPRANLRGVIGDSLPPGRRRGPPATRFTLPFFLSAGLTNPLTAPTPHSHVRPMLSLPVVPPGPSPVGFPCLASLCRPPCRVLSPVCCGVFVTSESVGLPCSGVCVPPCSVGGRLDGGNGCPKRLWPLWGEYGPNAGHCAERCRFTHIMACVRPVCVDSLNPCRYSCG